jgi:hypothetical protein
MDSMKTKFYKRLVPIALIASMAVTNVGMTSAGAQEIVEAGKSIVAPWVGLEDGDSFASNQAKAIKVTSGQTFTATYEEKNANGDYKSNECTVTVNLSELPSKKVLDENWFVISKVAPTKTSYSSLSASGTTEDKINEKKISITKTVTPYSGSTSGQDDPEPAGTADVFQIPGGLSKDKDNYVVGIRKVVAHATFESMTTATTTGTDAEKAAAKEALAKVVDASTIVEDTDTPANDTTIGEWDDDGEDLAGKYVLYYNADKADPADGRKYVKVFTEGKVKEVTDGEGESATTKNVYENGEVDNFPYGEWKTSDNLTTYKDDDKDEDKAKTDQFKIEAAVKAYFDAAFVAAAGGTDIAGWDKGLDVVAAVPLGEDNTAIADIAHKHTIAVPGVTALASGLKSNTKLIDLLIDAYNAMYAVNSSGETVEADTFKKQYTMADDPATTDVNEAHTPTNKWGESNAALDLWNPASTGSVTDAGYTVLLNEVLKKDYSILGDAANDETTKKLYDEVVAKVTATYLNTANETNYNAGPDFDKLNWVLETLEGESETVGTKTTYSATSGKAKFWAKKNAKATAESAVAKTAGATVKVTNTKASGKFNSAVYLKGVTSDYVAAKKGKAGKGTVIFSEGFYIPPAVPSAFKEATLAAKNKANAFDLKTVTGFDKSKSETTKFTLSIFSGKSYKLPFKLNDGQEKDLVYEVSNGSTGFTVVNGKVTGTDANGAELATSVDDFATKSKGKNVIKVYSRANPEVYALVQVQVLDAFKSIRANTTSLSVWPGSEQKVVLGTVPAMFGENYKYKITDGTGGKVDIGYFDGTGYHALDEGFIPVGFNTLVVKAKTGQEVAKGSKITVELWTTAATPSKVSMKKDLEIKVNPANAPQDIKTVKTGVKSKETKVLEDGSVVKVVNVPVGGSANLGYAVNPVAAKTNIIGSSDDNNVVSINGDVVTGNEEGTAVVTLSPDGGNISDTFKAKETDNEGTIKYFINVYTPGASIAFPETSDYTIKGGFLMSKAAAATDCDKNFTAYEPIIMPRPKTSGGDEEIIWKANNNAAVKFVDNGTNLTVTPLQTGTFTITGTTKYTKQSLKFKLNVVAENASNAVVPEGGALTLVKNGEEFNLAVAADAEHDIAAEDQDILYVGEKLNAYFGSGVANVGGKVKFTSSAPKVAAVNASGIITAKSAGDAKITATMTCGSKTVTKTFDITVSAIIPTIKSAKVAAGSVKGKAFKVSLGLNKFDKKTMTLEWYYSGEKADGTPVAETKLPGMTDNKLSGSATIADAGEYDIYAKIKVGSEYPYGNFEVTNTKFGQQEYVKIYESAINAINNNNGDADTKKAIAALGGKYDATNEKLKVNGRAGGDLYVPLFITEKGSDGKTVKATGTFDYDDFVWTTSNKSLANVEETLPITENYVGIEENDIIKNVSNASCVAHITLGQHTGAENVISGPVIIKGVCKNSNKTVTIKVNVVAGEKALNAAYNPQKLEELATPGVTLANIDDSSVNADKLANGTDGDTKVKAAAANVKEGKTFKMVKYVLVNGSTLKTINADTEHLVFEPKVANISKTDKSTFTDGLDVVQKATKDDFLTAKTAKSVTAFPREGTWYLAVADVTYKVTKAHKDEVKADAANNVAAQEEVNLELDETALKVTKIASKTPITKVDASSGQEEETNTDKEFIINGAAAADITLAMEEADFTPKSADTASETYKYVLINTEPDKDSVINISGDGVVVGGSEEDSQSGAATGQSPVIITVEDGTLTIPKEIAPGDYYLLTEKYDTANGNALTFTKAYANKIRIGSVNKVLPTAATSLGITNDGLTEANFTAIAYTNSFDFSGTLKVSSSYFNKDKEIEGFTATKAENGDLLIGYRGSDTGIKKFYVFKNNVVTPFEFRVNVTAGVAGVTDVKDFRDGTHYTNKQYTVTFDKFTATEGTYKWSKSSSDVTDNAIDAALKMQGTSFSEDGGGALSAGTGSTKSFFLTYDSDTAFSGNLYLMKLDSADSKYKFTGAVAKVDLTAARKVVLEGTTKNTPNLPFTIPEGTNTELSDGTLKLYTSSSSSINTVEVRRESIDSNTVSYSFQVTPTAYEDTSGQVCWVANENQPGTKLSEIIILYVTNPS